MQVNSVDLCLVHRRLSINITFRSFQSGNSRLLQAGVSERQQTVYLPPSPKSRMAPGEAEAFHPLTQDFLLCGRVGGEAGVDRLHLGGCHLSKHQAFMEQGSLGTWPYTDGVLHPDRVPGQPVLLPSSRGSQSHPV